VALKMVLSPFDAADITQEVLVKMVTHLSQFRGEANFRTWLYTIVFNHFRQAKKYWLEEHIITFDGLTNDLDGMEPIELSPIEQQEMKDVVEDARIGCMGGMLLCLDRDQRMVYVLGEIFGVDHALGSQMLSISRDNFRQRLSRARKDLYQFMNKKCGLVNKNNPCRCEKKTKSFIKAGWVDEQNLKFNSSYVQRIQEVAPEKANDLEDLIDNQYADQFRSTPFQEKPHHERVIPMLLQDDRVKQIFNLS
jgi:RNA polymerase sigma factor (sigma-70 family)